MPVHDASLEEREHCSTPEYGWDGQSLRMDMDIMKQISTRNGQVNFFINAVIIPSIWPNLPSLLVTQFILVVSPADWVKVSYASWMPNIKIFLGVVFCTRTAATRKEVHTF